MRRLLAGLGLYLLALIALDLVSMRSGRSGGKLINGDAKGYYAWLRSIALDHDVDFRNDYALIYPPEPQPPDTYLLTPRGLLADKYPIGVALVEAPGFLVGHIAAKALGYPADGVSAPYQLAVVIWLQLLCVASFAALWLALVRSGAQRAVAALVIASALLATNLLQYIARPAWSHGPGTAMLILAYCLLVAARGARKENGRIIAAGALLGLALIIRPSNLAIAPFFLAVLVGGFERWRGHLVRLALGAAPLIAIHIASMWALWGSFQMTGYANEGFTSGWKGIVGALFSSRHGLFVYHPWYLVMLGICVAALRSRSTRPLAMGTLLSFLAFACVNGTWVVWWFGDSFGNRAFIELIPALVITATLWCSSFPDSPRARVVRALAVAAILLAAVNLELWTGYVLRRFPPDGLHTVADAYLWPLKH